MKVVKLEIKNLGMIENMDIPVDKPLLLFYGQCCAGKTTILNAVKWCFGGAYPDDIIRHGEEEAYVVLHTSEGSIRRSWYRGKNGETKAREITVVANGASVKRPVEYLKAFLNPFILDQDHFKRMNDVDRRKYLIELFGVDTAAEDLELAKSEQTARDLRAVVKAYGTPVTQPVEKPDVESAQKALEFAKTHHAQRQNEIREEVKKLEASEQARQRTLDLKIDALRQAYEKRLAEVRARNEARKALVENRNEIAANLDKEREAIRKLEEELAQHKAALVSWETALSAAAVPNDSELEPTPPDYSALRKQRDDNSVFLSQREALLISLAAPANLGVQEAMVEQARQQQVKYDQYQQQLAKLAELKKYKDTLASQEERIKELRQAKVAKLDSFNDSKVPGLKFTEDGSFVYGDTAASMLSTSQIMELSARLESLYPEGLGLTLIDRGESLGTSIFKFIDEAKAGNKAILATIVGEKPATVPDEASVFVVKDGRIEK